MSVASVRGGAKGWGEGGEEKEAWMLVSMRGIGGGGGGVVVD